jgi:hypothetical protein
MARMTFLTLTDDRWSRVISMALIHEELYKEEGTDTLNFSEYLKMLANNLFQTYILSSKNIHLNMDLEENVLINMDTAVPLGIIVMNSFPILLNMHLPAEIKEKSESNSIKKKENVKRVPFLL